MSKFLSDYNSATTISSNVARKNTYADLSLSFVPHPINKDVMALTDIDAVKNSIKHLALTNFYDRPFNPALGSNLAALLFENNDNFLSVKIQDALYNVISIYEPRVANVNIEVNDTVDSNSILVTVQFQVVYSDNIYETTFSLNRLR